MVLCLALIRVLMPPFAIVGNNGILVGRIVCAIICYPFLPMRDIFPQIGLVHVINMAFIPVLYRCLYLIWIFLAIFLTLLFTSVGKVCISSVMLPISFVTFLGMPRASLTSHFPYMFAVMLIIDMALLMAVIGVITQYLPRIILRAVFAAARNAISIMWIELISRFPNLAPRTCLPASNDDPFRARLLIEADLLLGTFLAPRRQARCCGLIVIEGIISQVLVALRAALHLFISWGYYTKCVA